MDTKLKVAITHGDTNGIGYELILKAFATPELFDVCTPVLYGSEKILQYHRKALELTTPYRIISTPDEARDNTLNLIEVLGSGIEPNVVFGQSSDESGRYAFLSLEAATRDVAEGRLHALVTCPINVASMPREEFPFTSQNDYLGSRFQGQPVMMLCNPFMRVAFATNHVALSKVAETLTTETLENHIRLAYASADRDFLCSNSRVAVLGLNPHTSSNGTFGTEEADIIAPVIKKLETEGIRVFGPYASDGFFGAGLYKHFDCVLAMYHDQGVTPFKALSMDEGVNYTAGLNAVCVAPDHGPAYDIAGKGQASPLSFLHAIYTAVDIVRRREIYDEAHANPLPHIVQPDRREERRQRREE